MTKEVVVWEGRPSVFQFIGYYILTLIILFVGYKLTYMIASHPWYYVTNVIWNRPATSWRLHHWPQIALAAIYIVMVWFVIGSLYRILKSKLTHYQLLNDQVIITRFTPFGFVVHHTELYRLVDFEQVEPFALMIFGCSNIVLHSTDKQIPILELSAVRNGNEVVHFFRNETERVRREKGVREFTTRWN